MSDPTLQRTIRFYRVVAVGLLGGVVWLGFLVRQRDDALRRTGQAPAAVVAGSPAQRDVVVVQDLTPEIERLNSATGKGDGEIWLLQTPGGSLRLSVLGPRQQVPLHFQRVNHEVILPIFGLIEAAYLSVRGGQTTRHTAEPTTTTLLASPPYTARSWANKSTTQIAAALVFSSAAGEGRNYVEPTDDRIALGTRGEVIEASRLLARLRESGQPSIRDPHPLMEGRIETVAVSGEMIVAPRFGPCAVWIISGRGKLVSQRNRALAANHLIFVPAHTTAHIQAAAGAPLLLVEYQPDDLGVTSTVRTGKKIYSQFNEELLIRDFFQDRRGGFFLDVGCADYKHMSTTYYLEERLGWSGIGVDALSDYAAGYLAHRRRTRFLNYLVSDQSSGPRSFFRAPRYLELSSASRPVAADQQRELRGTAEVDEVKVATITLNDLLQEQGVGKIDFLSMDIEEHEPEALAGFDIERYRPQLVCVEAHRAVADVVYKYFRDHGYLRIDRYLPFDALNWYFTPQPSRATIGRAGT